MSHLNVIRRANPADFDALGQVLHRAIHEGADRDTLQRALPNRVSAGGCHQPDCRSRNQHINEVINLEAPLGAPGPTAEIGPFGGAGAALRVTSRVVYALSPCG